MRFLILLLSATLVLIRLPASAAGIPTLADCTVGVFNEINSSKAWSGKPPGGCSAKIVVEKRPSGVFVTAWAIEMVEGGWVRTAFSAAQSYSEIARKKDLANANRDIKARAKRLGRCLDSLKTNNDPLECRNKATRFYNAGEELGTEEQQLIWLDGTGRHTVVEYTYGDTTATPNPPADLFGGQQLPPGMIIDLHLGGGTRGGAGTNPGPGSQGP